ncbi:MAG: discoidin domain-containing protein [Clostridiaceae bacterium]|nr:discoidin domain-containing protein [Clostridiaceae bacterium]
MRSRNRKKNRGFTLVELLVVVAVMLVLASVLFFSITAWVNYSSFLNSESGAKSLYLSAQTALTYLDSRGGSEAFYASLRNPHEVSYTSGGQTVTKLVYALQDPAEIRALLEPYVYDASCFEHPICIEIDAETHTVYAVFYSVQAGALTYQTADGQNRHGTVSMANRDYASRKSVGLGYYSSEDIANVKLPGLKKLKITTLQLINDEQLQLQWATNASPEQINFELEFYTAAGRKLLEEPLRLAWGQTPAGERWLECGLGDESRRMYLVCRDGLFTLTLDAMMSAELAEKRTANDGTVVSILDLAAVEPDEMIYVQIKGSPVPDYEDTYTASSQIKSNSANPLYGNRSETDRISVTKFRHLYNIRSYPGEGGTVYTLEARSLVWTGTPVFVDTASDGPKTGAAFPAIPLLRRGDVFDGNARLGYALSEVALRAASVAAEEDAALGLFQNVQGRIENLRLTLVSLDTEESSAFVCAGAVAGRLQAGGALKNITVDGDIRAAVTGSDAPIGVGGVVGVAERAENAENLIDTVVMSGTVTGILPQTMPEIAGGAAWAAESDDTAAYAAGIGGVAGFSERSLAGVVNRAAVTGNTRVGGVAGCLCDSTAEDGAEPSIALTDSRNEALVLGSEEDGACIGGLIGYCWRAAFRDSSSEPEWEELPPQITQELLRGDYVGGIVGFNYYGTMTNCSTGAGGYILGRRHVGGIAGVYLGDLHDAVNAAAVIGWEYVGGITGSSAEGGRTNTVRSCVNNGIVLAGARYAGGIVGYNGAGSVINNCASCLYDYGDSKYQQALAWELRGDYAGGIAGYNNGSIRYSLDDASMQKENLAAIVIGRDYIGGIVGFNDTKGSIRVDYPIIGGKLNGRDFVGGYIGLNHAASVSENPVTVRPFGVTGRNFVGGVIGANIVTSEEAIQAVFAADNAMACITGEQYVGGLIGYQQTVRYDGANEAADFALLLDKIAASGETHTAFSMPERGIGSFSASEAEFILRGPADESVPANNVEVRAALLGGGIVGYCEMSTCLHIRQCWNTANVSQAEVRFAGLALTDYVELQELAEMTGTFLGGMIGFNPPEAVISESRSSGVVSADSVMGSICGLNLGRVENCTASVSLGAADTAFIGGIAGVNGAGGVIESCTVAQGVVVSGSDYVGGVAAVNLGRIQDCMQDADVVAIGSQTGGVAGLNNGEIRLSKETYTAEVRGGDNVGGVIGLAMEQSVLVLENENCLPRKSAQVSGGQNVGGAIGSNAGEVQVPEQLCAVNHAAVHASFGYAGGIIGYQNTEKLLKNMENRGSVTADLGYAGGIAAYAAAGSVLEGCVNYASVSNNYRGHSTLEQQAAGIVAVNYGTLLKCRVVAEEETAISGRGNLGGVAAENHGTIDGCTVTTAEAGKLMISGPALYIGGIAGVNGPDAELLRSAVSGAVTLASDDALPVIGGIVGKNLGVLDGTDTVEGTDGSTIVSDSVAALSITVPEAQYLGGVCGDNQGVILSYCFSGTLEDSGKSGPGRCIGGIAGRSGGENNAKIEHCRVLAPVDDVLIRANGVYTATSAAPHTVKAETSTIAGGICGVNAEGSLLCNVSVSGSGSSIVLQNGILGGVVGYNAGDIEYAGASAFLPLFDDPDQYESLEALDAAAQAAFEAWVDQPYELQLLLDDGGNGHVAGIAALNAPSGLLQKCATGRWYVLNNSTDPDSTGGGMIGLNEAERELTMLLNFADVQRSRVHTAGGVICRQENRTGGGWRISVCGNYGKVADNSDESTSAGVIACLKYTCGTLDLCWNRGETTGSGIVGEVYRFDSGETLNISSCVNYGKTKFAGIVYSLRSFDPSDSIVCNIVDCVNYGETRTGILDSVKDNNAYALQILRCRNYGACENGILGESVSTPQNSTVQDCFNIHEETKNPIAGVSGAQIRWSYYVDSATFEKPMTLSNLAGEDHPGIRPVIQKYTFWFDGVEFPADKTVSGGLGHQGNGTKPEYLLDGDPDTRWSFDREAAQNPVRLDISLSQSAALRRIDFNWFNPSSNKRAYTYHVTGRNEAGEWVNLASGSTSRDLENNTRTSADITVGMMFDEIRIEFDGTNRDISLYDVQLFDTYGNSILLQPEEMNGESASGTRLFAGSVANPGEDEYPAYAAVLKQDETTRDEILANPKQYGLEKDTILNAEDAHIGTAILRFESDVQTTGDVSDQYVREYYLRLLADAGQQAPTSVTAISRGTLNLVQWESNGTVAGYETEIYVFAGSGAAESFRNTEDASQATAQLTGLKTYGASAVQFTRAERWQGEYFVARVRALGLQSASAWTYSPVTAFTDPVPTPVIRAELFPTSATTDGNNGSYAYRFCVENADAIDEAAAERPWRVRVTLDNNESSAFYLDAEHPYVYTTKMANESRPLTVQAEILDENGELYSASNKYSEQTNMTSHTNTQLLVSLGDVTAAFQGTEADTLTCAVTLQREGCSAITPIYRVELVRVQDETETVVAYMDVSLPQTGSAVTATLRDLPADLFREDSTVYVRAWLAEAGMGSTYLYHALSAPEETVTDVSSDGKTAYTHRYQATSTLLCSGMNEPEYTYSVVLANRSDLGRLYGRDDVRVPVLLPAPVLEAPVLVAENNTAAYLFSWDTDLADSDARYHVTVSGLLEEKMPDGSIQQSEVILYTGTALAARELLLDGTAWDYEQVVFRVTRLGSADADGNTVTLGYTTSETYTLARRLPQIGRPVVILASLNDLLYTVSWRSLPDETDCSAYALYAVDENGQTALLTTLLLDEAEKTTDTSVVRRVERIDLEQYAGRRIEIYLVALARAGSGLYDSPSGIPCPVTVHSRMPADDLVITKTWQDGKALLAAEFTGGGLGIQLTSDRNIAGNYVAAALLYKQPPAAAITAENWKTSGYDAAVGLDAPLTLAAAGAENGRFRYTGAFRNIGTEYAGYTVVFLVRGTSQTDISSVWTASQPFALPNIRLDKPVLARQLVYRTIRGAVYNNDAYVDGIPLETSNYFYAVSWSLPVQSSGCSVTITYQNAFAGMETERFVLECTDGLITLTLQDGRKVPLSSEPQDLTLAMTLQGKSVIDGSEKYFRYLVPAAIQTGWNADGELVCTLLLPDPETLIHGETFTFTQSVRVTATSLREQYEPSEEAEFRF